MKIHLELKVVRIEIQIHLILEGELPGLKEMLPTVQKKFFEMQIHFWCIFVPLDIYGRASYRA